MDAKTAGGLHTAFEGAVAALTSMFEARTKDPKPAGMAWSEDETCTYSVCLNQGDADAVIAMVVREADRSVALRLDAVLDVRRIASWRKIAKRYVCDADALAEMSQTMKRETRTANAIHVVGFRVEDDFLLDTARAFRSKKVKIALHGLKLSVEDGLDCHFVDVTMAHAPTEDEWEIVRSILADLRGVSDFVANGWFIDPRNEQPGLSPEQIRASPALS